MAIEIVPEEEMHMTHKSPSQHFQLEYLGQEIARLQSDLYAMEIKRNTASVNLVATIEENTKLLAEVARLTEEVNYWKIADNHHQEVMAQAEAANAKLRAALEEAQGVIRDLLQSYLITFNGNKDALVYRAEAALANEQEGK
jgi:uncharacterized coiled-coil DUF342 family protein